MNSSPSIAKLAAALVKAQRAMGTAIKDSVNPFFNSKFADLNAIREAVLPALQEQGFAVLQPTVNIDGKNFVETIFMHESGEFISGFTEIKEIRNNNPQDNGAGTTYARRFGLQSMANCGAEDDDGDYARKTMEAQAKKAQSVPAIPTAAKPAEPTKAAEAPKTVSSFRKTKTEKVATPNAPAVSNGNGATVAAESGWEN